MPHQPERLLRGVDLGDDDAGRADIQGLLGPDLLPGRDTQERRATGPDPLQEPQCAGALERPVFGIDEQPVETDLGQQFGDVGRWQTDECADQSIAGQEPRAKRRVQVWHAPLR